MAILAKFSHPHIFNAPTHEFLLKFYDGGGIQKNLEKWPYSKSLTIYPFV